MIKIDGLRLLARTTTLDVKRDRDGPHHGVLARATVMSDLARNSRLSARPAAAGNVSSTVGSVAVLISAEGTAMGAAEHVRGR